jgi:uncharacterized membrane protein (DUF2068 family)
LQPAAPPPEKRNFGTDEKPLIVDIPSAESMLTGTYNLLACVSVVEIAIGLVLGIGLWRLRPWARPLAMWLYALGGIGTLCLSLNRPLTGANLIGLVISAAAVYYLTRPEVARAFMPPLN